MSKKIVIPVSNKDSLYLCKVKKCTVLSHWLMSNVISSILMKNCLFQVPQLFIDGKYIGGWREIPRLHKSGKLAEMVYNWKKK